MSRNPYAASLRHFRPKRIEDKRDKGPCPESYWTEHELWLGCIDVTDMSREERARVFFGDDIEALDEEAATYITFPGKVWGD